MKHYRAVHHSLWPDGLDEVLKTERSQPEPFTRRELEHRLGDQRSPTYLVLAVDTRDRIAGHLIYTCDEKERFVVVDRIAARGRNSLAAISPVLLEHLKDGGQFKRRRWVRAWVPLVSDQTALCRALADCGFSSFLEDHNVIRFGLRSCAERSETWTLQKKS